LNVAGFVAELPRLVGVFLDLSEGEAGMRGKLPFINCS
jgi:hypothetical protein